MRRRHRLEYFFKVQHGPDTEMRQLMSKVVSAVEDEHLREAMLKRTKSEPVFLSEEYLESTIHAQDQAQMKVRRF
jgi:hypothetical protein